MSTLQTPSTFKRAPEDSGPKRPLHLARQNELWKSGYVELVPHHQPLCKAGGKKQKHLPGIPSNPS